ncbi:clathrin heavy chain linker domain-containing protein 1-like isoform X2 [Acanthaster planci]|uniref:Clathrin heavy chain linker domain-containing protein 1-like isoform X2 n=1 Tax=Acanthaster planci TaxID=133434 RepID=A0A8B8A072_ACAPL|nr:clathrin heavy chain linker domain-containing protein 1-like isoform X2 [Acanthaster planci]
MQHSTEEKILTARPVLPPIKPEILDQHTQQRLKNGLECNAVEEMLAEYLPGYCPLLMAVKAEFENCIQTIQRGNQEALYLSGKIRSMVAEQTTLSYYTRRIDQLKQIIPVIQSNNKKLHPEQMTIQMESGDHLQEIQEQVISVEVPVDNGHVNAPKRLFHGLILGESIDVEHLRKQSSSLDQQVNNLRQARKSHYTPREQKDRLKVQLATKTKAKDLVTEKNFQLKARCRKLRVALDALRVYEKDALVQPTQAEVIIHALTRSNSKMSSRSTDVLSSTFDDDDPSKEREAEMLLDYIEYFNELFGEGNYKDAAMHAASSPKGILRNSETLSRFKGISARSGKTSPLLIYCEALVSSVPAVGLLPNAETSLECVKSALVEDRLDLVMYWLAQKRLTCSEPLGHLLYNYTQGKSEDILSKGLPLAEAVYTEVDAQIQAAVCMCKQGKVQAMADYAISAGFGKDMYVGVLVACPSLALAEVLIQLRDTKGKPALSVGAVVFALLQTDSYTVGLQLLDEIHQRIKSVHFYHSQYRYGFGAMPANKRRHQESHLLVPGTSPYTAGIDMDFTTLPAQTDF